MNDVSVICVSRCGITRGTFYGKHVLTLIWVIMTDGSFKIVSNWAVLTIARDFDPMIDEASGSHGCWLSREDSGGRCFLNLWLQH